MHTYHTPVLVDRGNVVARTLSAQNGGSKESPGAGFRATTGESATATLTGETSGET